MPTPKILRVVCRGTVDLGIKNDYYKIISCYIESLSRLGAVPRCNPATLSTRNLDRLKASFEEDIVSELSDEDARTCRVQLEVLYLLYRGLELFELQGGRVAGQFLSDVVDGKQTKPAVRLELIQNEKFTRIQEEFAKIEENHESLNDSTMRSKITKLADILDQLFLQSTTPQKVVIVVPTVAACEEVNKTLAGISNFISSYPYDPKMYSKQIHRKFIESENNCIVVISTSKNLKGQHISLIGVTFAICLDVPKTVLRKPAHWPGSVYMLLTDLENKSFQADSLLENSPRKPCATLKRGLARQASRPRKAFLTKEELKYFDRHFRCSTKIRLPSSRPETLSRSQSSDCVQLSLSKWRPWQNRLQETFEIGHSVATHVLVDVFRFCDEVTANRTNDSTRGCRDDVALYLCADDVHLCEHKYPLSTSRHESSSAHLTSFDIDAINALAITPELDRYILNSEKKIHDYLLELGIFEEKELFLENHSQTKSPLPREVSQQTDAEMICFANSSDRSVIDKHDTVSECSRNVASPLVISGKLPETSTPFTNRDVPRADFKMTPVVRRQATGQRTPKANSVENSEPGSHESTRLSLTELVNVVQKRKKQRNLQHFFNNQANQQVELSAIAEVVKESPLEASDEICSNEEGAHDDCVDVISVACASKHVDHDCRHDRTIVDDTENDCMIIEVQKEKKTHLSQQSNHRVNKSGDVQRSDTAKLDDGTHKDKDNDEDNDEDKDGGGGGGDDDDDDDSIFADIDMDCLVSMKQKTEQSVVTVMNVEKDAANHDRNAPSKTSSDVVVHVRPFQAAQATKVQPKHVAKSVFDALTAVKSPSDCYAANDAVLNIINNVPTRSKHAAASEVDEQFEEVGNIFSKEFQEEIKRTSDTDGDSDSLFDLVDDPLVPRKESTEQDVILEKLLRKADEHSRKNAVEPSTSKKNINSLKPKAFRKQNVDEFVTPEPNMDQNSSVEYRMRSFGRQPSTSQLIKAPVSTSNRYAAARSSNDLKRPRQSSNSRSNSNNNKSNNKSNSNNSSSDESAICRRRKRKQVLPSESVVTSKPDEDELPKNRKQVSNSFFDDEAEVDSLESVSDDEDDRQDAYEINSFVDDNDENDHKHSQGMYHRLNRDLSPRVKVRQPRNLVAYEDCFSQLPSDRDQDDSYGDDSFIEKESVADVTLPAEITINDDSPELKRKNKKTLRRAFICDDSSSEEHHQQTEQTTATQAIVNPNRENSSELLSTTNRLVSASSDRTEFNCTQVNKRSENVILVNTALLELLPEILVGLHRTFTGCHIEPVEMVSLENHPVDVYLGVLCLQIVALESLSLRETQVRRQLERLTAACESPVFVLLSPNGNKIVSDRVYRPIIEISQIRRVRMFFVKGQVELLMLLKCILKQPTKDQCLMRFIESEELRLLLKIPQLNIRTASELLDAKSGKALNVIRTSSVAEIENICNVSPQFARSIYAAFNEFNRKPSKLLDT